MTTRGASVMNGEGSSRKRLKISRNGARVPGAAEVVATASSSTMPGLAVSTTSTVAATPDKGPCYHEQALKTLHTDIDAMRSLVTCQICHKFMFEPYALSCGHTYCYSCLSQWLGSNRKKSCPDCRAVITQQPAPSYTIRELVLIFTSRSELLPDGETAEESAIMGKEEAAIVARDKLNTDAITGGLFKGCFNRRRALMMPVRDPDDGVERCPACMWEIDGGVCSGCGLPMGDSDGLSDSDESGRSSDEDVDGDIDIEDDDVALGMGMDMDQYPGWGSSEDDGYHNFGDVDPATFAAAFGGYDGAQPRRRPFVAGGRRIAGRPRHHVVQTARNRPLDRTPNDVESDPSSTDSDTDTDLDGFIAGENGSSDVNPGDDGDSSSSDDTAVQVVATRPRQTRRVVDASDDEDDAPRETVVIDSSDAEPPVHNGNRRAKRTTRVIYRQRPHTVPTSDEDSSSSDDESEVVQNGWPVENDAESETEQPAYGFSPIQSRGSSVVSSQYADGMDGTHDDGPDAVHNYGLLSESEETSSSDELENHGLGFTEEEETSSNDDNDDDQAPAGAGADGWGLHAPLLNYKALTDNL